MSPDNSPVLEKTALNFKDLRDEGLDYATESYLAKFFIKDEDNLTTVISNYTKAGHERRKLENREYIEIEINFLMTPPLILSHSIQFLTLRSTSIEIFIALVQYRFGSFRDDISCLSM